MLTHEENVLLTQVSRGTPCGELLRRYWHPVAAAAELTEEKPIRAVKILNEELAVYRNRKGEYGLVGEHCRTVQHPWPTAGLTRKAFAVLITVGSSIRPAVVSNSRPSPRIAHSKTASSMSPIRCNI